MENVLKSIAALCLPAVFVSMWLSNPATLLVWICILFAALIFWAFPDSNKKGTL